MSEQKVIILDGGFYCHKAIFAYISGYKREIEKVCKELKYDYDSKEDQETFIKAKHIVDVKVANRELWISPSDYTYFQMILSDLKKIGVNRDDIIIVALDGRNSWRKVFLPEYKGNRKALRDNQTDFVDWGEEYDRIDGINHTLNASTNWNFIKFNLVFDFMELYFTEEGQKYDINQHKDLFINESFSIEADDIQAYAVRYFKDKEVVLITIDEDLDQLYYYKNCKIFNPNLKSVTNKSVRGYYNVVEDPIGIFSKKVRTGDTSDNIIVDKNKDSKYDHDIRELIIYLLKLPSFVEERVEEELNNLNYNKKVSYADLPFQNSLAKRFDTIYDLKSVRTYEQSVKRHELKKEKDAEKRKIAYEKQKAKKQAKKEKSLR